MANKPLSLDFTPSASVQVAPPKTSADTQIGARLMYLNQTIRQTMAADDYVTAAKAKQERDQLLASSEGRFMVSTLRAATTALGANALLDPETQASVADLLPETLEQELRGMGRSLQHLENRSNKAFFMQNGVAEDDAQLMSRLFSLTDRLNPDGEEYFRASRMYRLYNEYKTDPARARAEMDKFEAGVQVIRRGVTDPADPKVTPVSLDAAQDVYDASQKVGWTPERAAGLLKFGMQAAKHQPGRSPDDEHYDVRFALNFVTSHAAAALRTEGYGDTLQALIDNNWVDPRMEATEMASRVSRVARRADETLNKSGLLASRAVTPAEQNTILRAIASEEGVTAAWPERDAEVAALSRSLEGRGFSAVIAQGGIGELSDGARATAATTLVAGASPETLAKVPAARAMQTVKARGDAAAQQFTMLFEAEGMDPAVAAMAGRVGPVLAANLDDPRERDMAILAAKNILAAWETDPKSVGIELSGVALDELRKIAQTPTSTAVARNYPGRAEYLLNEARRVGDPRSGMVPEMVAETADENLRLLEREIGRKLESITTSALWRNQGAGAVLQVLRGTTVSVAGVNTSLLEVLQRTSAGRVIVSGVATDAKNQKWRSGAGKAFRAFAGVFGEVGDELMEATGWLASVGPYLFSSKQDAASTFRSDRKQLGRWVVNQLLEAGNVTVDSLGQVSLKPVAAVAPQTAEGMEAASKGFPEAVQRFRDAVNEGLQQQGGVRGNPSFSKLIAQGGRLTLNMQQSAEDLRNLTASPQGAAALQQMASDGGYGGQPASPYFSAVSGISTRGSLIDEGMLAQGMRVARWVDAMRKMNPTARGKSAEELRLAADTEKGKRLVAKYHALVGRANEFTRKEQVVPAELEAQINAVLAAINALDAESEVAE